jgi:hypothetical protein
VKDLTSKTFGTVRSRQELHTNDRKSNDHDKEQEQMCQNEKGGAEAKKGFTSTRIQVSFFH